MDVTLINEATRAGNVVALVRLTYCAGTAPGETLSYFTTHVVFFRLEHAGGARSEQWCRVAESYAEAVELYQRGVDDFIEPVPFVPSSPTNESVFHGPPKGESSEVSGFGPSGEPSTAPEVVS